MSKPKISIGSWAFAFGPFEADPWSFERVVKYTADAGFDGLEICGFEPHAHPDTCDTPDKCRELAKILEDNGLGTSGYAADFMSVPPSVVDADAYLAVFRKCLAVCEGIGIPGIRVDTVSPPDALAQDEYDKRFARLAATWNAASAEAAQAGMALVWEFEPGFWLNKPSDVKRLVEAVGHDNFKVLFDTSHAYMGAVVGARQPGDPELLPGGVAEYAALLGPDIGHLHLIDSDGSLHGDETSTHSPFGDGHIDFKAALEPVQEQLLAMPWWCIDLCFCAESEVAGRNGVAFVRKLIDEL